MQHLVELLVRLTAGEEIGAMAHMGGLIPSALH